MPERITFQQKSMLPGIKAPGRSDEAAEIRRTSVDIAILRDTRSIIVRSLPARGNLACPGTDVTGPIRPEDVMYCLCGMKRVRDLYIKWPSAEICDFHILTAVPHLNQSVLFLELIS